MIKAKLDAKTKTKMSPRRTKTKIKTAAKNKSGKHKVRDGKTRTSQAQNQDGKAPATAPIYLTEADVRRLVTVKDAIATLEELFATWSDPSTINLPRQRARAGNGTFNLMGASWGPKKLFRLKAYFGGGGDGRIMRCFIRRPMGSSRRSSRPIISARCVPAR